MDFRCRVLSSLCKRNATPKETFARIQLAAISWIFIGFITFSLDLYDFMDFRVGCLAAFAIGMLAIKKLLLDVSCCYFIDF